MKCSYDDGVKVDYSGSLRISKGDAVSVIIKGDDIPSNYKGILDWAQHSHNCSDIRRVAEELTESYKKE